MIEIINYVCFLFQLDDAALQVYKDGDFGTYLDLESSLAEQCEDIEGLPSR
jgi:Formin N-terminal GTPase-binding domain